MLKFARAAPAPSWPVAIQLGEFDPMRLEQDLQAVMAGVASQAQPGPYHNGAWTGISLYSQGGRAGAKPGTPGLEPYAPTDALERAPYFREVLNQPWPNEVVRLLFLPPGATIGAHFDYDTNFLYGLIRLHIPIVTHPDVDFRIAEQRCTWLQGQLWYGDFTQPHTVVNRSPVLRAHLVMDVEITNELLALFPPEFVEQQRRSGISLYRPPLPTSPETLRSYECHFQVPAAVLPLLTFGRPFRRLMAGALASIREVGGRLIVALDGEAAFALERVGDDEFGIVGLPAGCFLAFVKAGGMLSEVKLIMKGVPEDFYAARMGLPCGPSNRICELSLPL